MTAEEQKMFTMMQEAMQSQAESLRLLTEQSAKKDKVIQQLTARVEELTAQLAWFQRQYEKRRK